MATLFISTSAEKKDNRGGVHVVDAFKYMAMYADLPKEVQPSAKELDEYLVADVQSRLALEPIGEDVVLLVPSAPTGRSMETWEAVAIACGAEIEFI